MSPQAEKKKENDLILRQMQLHNYFLSQNFGNIDANICWNNRDSTSIPFSLWIIDDFHEKRMQFELGLLLLKALW